MILLDDEIAVITGGSSGIGRGIALAFAEHGAKGVVIADIREDPKEEGVATHEKVETETDADAAFVHCNVTDRDDIATAMDTAGEFGGVSIFLQGGNPTTATLTTLRCSSRMPTVIFNFR
jgi:NAD(P)-dependent dehydrogenase (short-subunit alcohol dehydrogenase family)